MKHVSVMTKEVSEYVNNAKHKYYFDCTLGGGGHSLEILENNKEINLVCCDLDEKAIEAFVKKLGSTHLENISDSISKTEYKGNFVYLVNANFMDIRDICEALNIGSLDCIIADLGWSSDQLETLEGLSFENADDLLDMRADKNLNIKASDLLNALGYREIESVLVRYADFNKVDARILSSEIMDNRPFKTVGDLVNVVDSVVGQMGNRARRNVMQTKARIFQALRIAVNTEYDNLEKLLNEGNDLLSEGGRMIILTFHSGEHSIVENFIKNNNSIEVLSGNKHEIYDAPSISEMKENNRSRSAKLWALQKI